MVRNVLRESVPLKLLFLQVYSPAKYSIATEDMVLISSYPVKQNIIATVKIRLLIICHQKNLVIWLIGRD